MLRRGTRGDAGSIGNEHGAAMIEYMPLLGVVALLVVLAVTFFGPWVSERLVNASLPFDEYGCTTGWDPQHVINDQPPLKKNGRPVNKNNDEWVCVKDIPGSGNGNTGGGQNVKDNNRTIP